MRKTQKFLRVSKNFYSLTIEVKKHQRHKLLILFFKDVLKISNFEKSAKTSKNLKTNFKKGLFYAKFFEFEEFF